ncbi:hypothetical protein J4E91_002534 [Alternaria rosae]|nr:hypothetical protein J4E91_002534 [Alternaria rosae]
MHRHEENEQKKDGGDCTGREANLALLRTNAREIGGESPRDETTGLMYWLNRDEEDQQSQEIDKSKECGTDQESKEREEREANLALSLAIIREDAEGRDEIPVPMSKRPRDEEQSKAYVDDVSHKGPLKEAGEKLPAVNNLQTYYDADLQSNPTPRMSHKRQCCGPPNPPLNEPAVDPQQRDLTEAPSSSSNSTTAPLDHYIRLLVQ